MELLAPAGNIECFHAAIEAGADAVYLGLDQLNARLRAKNFTVRALSGLIPYAHSRKRKVHVALNTVVKQSELKRLLDLLYQLEQLRPDALIAADPGLIEIAREHFPGLALHGSTQMAVHNSDAVAAAAAMGLERVILSRELTLDEMGTIAARAPVELEVFVHGALCYSLSGLCLASSFLGGASANRGRCTQVCRRMFKGNRERGFYFSANDLCALQFVPRYREMGIACLKIEGRMRNAQYVHRAVSVYREAIDDPGRIGQLQGEIRFDMGREKSVFFLPGLRQEGIIAADRFGGTGIYLGEVRRLEGTAIVVETGNTETSEPVCPGDQLRIHPPSGFAGTRARVTGVEPCPDGRLLRLSESAGIAAGAGVYLTSIRKQKAPAVQLANIPMKTRTPRGQCPHASRILGRYSPARKRARPPGQARLLVKIDDLAWLPLLEELRFDSAIAQLGLGPATALLDDRALLERWKRRLVPAFPPFIPEPELEAWRVVCRGLGRAGLRRWACEHPGQRLLLGRGGTAIADSPIWCLNRPAQKALREQGLEQFCYSVEDDFPNIRATASPDGIAYLFGRVPLFISRIRPAVENGAVLSDARDQSFVAVERHGLFYLVSSQPLCLFHQRKRLDECGIGNYLIDLSFYRPEAAFACKLIEHFHSRSRFTPSTTFNFKGSLR